MNRCCLFDLDGTLLDSIADIAAAVNDMRMKLALPLHDLDTVKTFVGDGIGQLAERAVADADVDVPTALRMVKEYYFGHLMVHTRLYPGVKEGLVRLKDAGFRLGVVTNKPEGAAVDVLKMFHIDTLFEDVAGGGGAYPLKPAPDGCRGLLKQLDADPGVSYMIGDHFTDLAAGVGAGMITVWARWGFGDPRGERIDLAFDSFSEMTEAILNRS